MSPEGERKGLDSAVADAQTYDELEKSFERVSTADRPPECRYVYIRYCVERAQTLHIADAVACSLTSTLVTRYKLAAYTSSSLREHGLTCAICACC